MINVDTSALSPREQNVLDTLAAHARNNPAPSIVEAASLCACSVSHVSKAVKRAGFGGYKQYIRYLYFGRQPEKAPLAELERLKQVIDEFDASVVEAFAAQIQEYKKILFFGYGPSRICAQYAEYKLRLCTDVFIATPADETSLQNMADASTLLTIFSTTGKYSSFNDIYRYAKSCGTDVVVVSEEFNSRLMDNCDHYYVLAQHEQPETLLPHHKTRTVFFLFIEQVVQHILAEQAPQNA
ncbi:MAG: MurR/RpiR family transcriptional regulator [Thermodesulfobacteriota bacterium]